MKQAAQYLCLFLALGVGSAFASLDPDKPLSQFIHQSWTAAQGLPQNSVLALAQTANGYLWLGTEEGLVRFDGVNFTIFDKHTSGLNDNMVNALLVDHNQDLWIGSNSGLTCFKNGKFIAYGLKVGLSSNTVRALYEDKDQVLWIGTDGAGLVRMKDGVFRVFTKTDGLADNAVFSISGDEQGTLWVGTHGGLSRLQSGRFLNYGRDQGLDSDYVHAVHVDHEGTVWIGTNGGLSRIDAAGQILHFAPKEGLPNTAVSHIYEDRAGTLWIGTSERGLLRFVKGRFETYSDKRGPLGRNIFSLFEDREGDLWIGTGGAGLNCLKSGVFVTLSREDGLVSDNILGVYQDDDQNLWIGSEKGLMRMKAGDLDSIALRNELPETYVFTMTKDREGSLWAGTQKGLVRITNGHTKTYGVADGAPEALVLCSYTDRQGTVWFGSRNGLTRFTGTGFMRYTTRDGLSNNFVLSIYEDKSGSLWIGTAGGLNQFKNGRFRSYTTHDGLSSDWIWSIYGDQDGSFWLSTSGGGVDRFKNGKFASITSRQGLFNDNVSGIADDRLGRFWMTSNKGVFTVGTKELNDLADGLISRVTSVVYGLNDGLRSRECNGGFQPSIWRTQDGRIFIPTTGGLSIVDPAHLPKAEVPSQPLIERIVANNKEADPAHAVSVPPGKGQLEFQFTAPSFVSPEKLQFRYMLDGFDKDWTAAGTRRVAYYTNIPHGEYRFRVRVGMNGHWGAGDQSVSITLQPHFYQTFTFDAILVIAALGLCAALYRLRVDQLKIREKKLISLVNERTSALQESERQLRRSRDELDVRVRERTLELVNANKALEEEISVRRQTEEQLISAKDAAEAASRAKSDFLANMSHEIRTPINGIIGMADVVLSTNLDVEQREYLEIVKFSGDSLLAIVNDILDFSKIEARKLSLDRTAFDLGPAVHELIRSLQMRARQKGLHLHCSTSDDVPKLLLGDPLRLRQVLLNLLDNAIKFTSIGGVTLSISQENRFADKTLLHFAVKDTGIGIPAGKQNTIFEAFSQADTSSTRQYGGTGLGLTISYQLATMMGGRLWVESEPGQGSTFHFTACMEVLSPQPSAPAVSERVASLPA